MRIAVASGKGGTGKTTVAVNLAEAYGGRIQLLDCDVEAPNARLFLSGGDSAGQEEIAIPVPVVVASSCDGCGECGSFCRYHAIVCLGSEPLFFHELCHGCGGCTLVCPRGAIRESTRRIGIIDTFQTGAVTLVQGTLDVGVAQAPPLIRAVRQRADSSIPQIVDAPPGTSCPVIAAIRDTDFVILVTEPTPFGLHDLKLAMQMVRELQLPFGVVINRDGSGDDRVLEYCSLEDIPVLARIPDDRRVAEAYSRGHIAVDVFPEYADLYRGLLEIVTSACKPAAGESSQSGRSDTPDTLFRMIRQLEEK